MPEAMTAQLFLGFVALMAAIVVALIAHFLHRRSAWWVAGGLVVWFLYAGLLASSGILKNPTMRPPGLTLILVPVLLVLVSFLVVVVRSSAGAHLALAFPLWIILGMQTFRVGVELFLHQIWIDGLAPKMLTFAGANVDIYIGASAPLIAWLAIRGRTGMKLALVWNGLGLLALANVVVRAVLTAPGPLNLIHAEVPDTMLSTFPFVFLPGFFVPLAVVLHVIAIRAIVAKLDAT